ncbi:hypothetical protein [Puia dinghuensis]|uniref:Uncharacterized protein n=1 Tax=Puia dinghuensis TaxID=1792502 RepID=A0A8J2UE52_9BACT|nr:hypothetical protein [Puia dinghuensis]GGB05240.1 hypothetical protein GCM10011511_30730 [Puia dinghuensis]
MMDQDHDKTREILRMSGRDAAPHGLELRVMDNIMAIANKRAKRRAALSGLLRFVAISLVVIAAAQSFFPGGSGKAVTVVPAVGQMTENLGAKIAGLLEYSYFFIPLIAVYVFRQIARIKAG